MSEWPIGQSRSHSHRIVVSKRRGIPPQSPGLPRNERELLVVADLQRVDCCSFAATRCTAARHRRLCDQQRIPRLSKGDQLFAQLSPRQRGMWKLVQLIQDRFRYTLYTTSSGRTKATADYIRHCSCVDQIVKASHLRRHV